MVDGLPPGVDSAPAQSYEQCKKKRADEGSPQHISQTCTLIACSRVPTFQYEPRRTAIYTARKGQDGQQTWATQITRTWTLLTTTNTKPADSKKPDKSARV